MRKVKLLDVVNINNESVKKYEGNKRYIATGDLNGGVITSFTDVSYDEKPSRANVQVSMNQVIFARMKGTNKVLRINEINKDYIYSTGFCVLEPQKQVSTEYFELVLKSELFQRQKDKYSKGATQKAINNTELKKIKIPLPPLQTQKKIVEVLDKAQELIDTRKEQIKLLDDLIQSIFYDMFGDPVTNPKEWEVKEFENVINCYDSRRIPVKKSDRDNMEGIYPYYGATGIIDYVNNYIFEGTYLLIAEDGKNLVNRTKPIAFIATNKFWVNNHAHIVQTKSNIELIYLREHFEKIDISSYITGIDQFKLNRSNLNRINIPVPPIHLQNQFAQKVQKIESQKELMQQSLTEMENNFNNLMQRAFKGELFKD